MSTFWCQVCEEKVSMQDALQEDDTIPYEFWGERGTHKIVMFKCPACDEELEDYEGQDDTGSTDADTDC